MASPAIPITGDQAADLLLEEDPLALLIGMLLDQQVPMEWAFKGPHTLRERLGGELSAERIAAMDTEDFVAVCGWMCWPRRAQALAPWHAAAAADVALLREALTHH